MGAFIFRWLTLDGAQSATVVGTVAFGLGDWQMALLLVVFFISASLISKKAVKTSEYSTQVSRRTGEQVWANGFWFACWIILWSLTDEFAFLAAAAAAVAAATADTWATEVGTASGKNTYLIYGRKKVEPGTNGGISVPGTLAAAGGSLLMAALFWLLFREISPVWILLITVAGITGCLADSLIGARLEKHRFTVTLVPNHLSFKLTLNNNNVNWIATGISSVLIIFSSLIF